MVCGDKLRTHSFQAALRNARKSLQEFVAKIVVLFSFPAKAVTIHSERSSRIEGSGRELPAIRGKQPRPTQNIAVSESHDVEGTPALGGYVKLNSSLADEVELVGVFALVKNEFPSLKAHIRGATGNQFEVTCREISKERMRS
jgi:hypothetical protein